MVIQTLFAAALLLPTMGASRTPVSQEAQVRTAVARSLPFLAKEGAAWMKEKGCVSCHHVPFLLWSHNTARSRGVPVDSGEVSKWTDWSLQFSHTRRAWFKLTNESLTTAKAIPEATGVSAKLKALIDKPFATEAEYTAELHRTLDSSEAERYRARLVDLARRPPEPENDGGGLDTMAQLLLGRDRSQRGKNDAAFVADVADVIVRWQRPDGSWKASGQLPSQNRAADETDRVSTMWAVLALDSVGDLAPSPPVTEAIRRARQWLAKVPPGETNESLICTLLLARQAGDRERAADLLRQLFRGQNPDGGWAWRQGGASDAFATGQALYALGVCGLTGSNPNVRRAQNYLIGFQGMDGSWSVPSKAVSSASTEARINKVEPIYRYWGTAWATIGLAATLPPPRRAAGTTTPTP